MRLPKRFDAVVPDTPRPTTYAIAEELARAIPMLARLARF
jgi:hypothetical protein